MDKNYGHLDLEQNMYRLWEKNDSFKAKRVKGKKAFTITMPPPNANDPLHIGHARFVAIEDTLTRYHRMQGASTLWLPGADHAGIETQFVFEKKLKEKGHSRFDYDRETLYNMIWEYVEKNTGVMKAQLKALGASCDWSRFNFTLDKDIIQIVYNNFKILYDDGLIYRGKRIVNYCPRCGTNFSDLEVDSVEREGNLYYLDYKSITIATTRPETIFADVAIAVNPNDSRYKNLIGKTATIPLVDREIPIIADRAVDIKFGTGALKVTPGHDQLDFEIGERHKLQVISVIDEKGRMINTPEDYVGLKAEAAREKVVEDLRSAGRITKTKVVKQVIGICYRDKGVIEPSVSEQWFLTIKPLSEKAISAIKNKEVVFASEQYKKIALHWLKNLRDWNISRQIVWGMRIPAYRCEKCLNWTITDGPSPEKCTCGHDKFKQDQDTFDTWFSSGQWPFATLMANNMEDFKYFYPTSVMNTSYDILPFWVIRMIMLGLYVTNKVPFKSVLIHGLVRDREGQKISKSKGNVIDPIDMVKKYGADSLRMALLWGATVSRDISLNEDNIRAQRNFANKVWNVARFIYGEETTKKYKIQTRAPRTTNADDKEILKELKLVTKLVTSKLDKYQLNEGAEGIYDFFWNKFASNYLEKTKGRKEEAEPVLVYVLQQSLKLLHPFMPFVTEAVWSIGLKRDKQMFDSELLITAQWPK